MAQGTSNSIRIWAGFQVIWTELLHLCVQTGSHIHSTPIEKPFNSVSNHIDRHEVKVALIEEDKS